MWWIMVGENIGKREKRMVGVGGDCLIFKQLSLEYNNDAETTAAKQFS